MSGRQGQAPRCRACEKGLVRTLYIKRKRSEMPAGRVPTMARVGTVCDACRSVKLERRLKP